MRTLRSYSLFILLLALSAQLAAEVKLPALLSDHMVLQRDEPIRIWGTADPGEQVKVQFRAVEKAVVANESGRWELFLPPQIAGGPDVLKVTGKNQLTIQDVLVGEVWLASGQSNMEWPVRLSRGAREEIGAANHPKLRLFKAPHRIAEAPMDDVNATWTSATPESIPNFSAVAYVFGRRLHQHLNVPVGLIQAARGGTPAESWIGKEELHAHPQLHFYLNKWARLLSEYPEANKKYEAEMKRWEETGKVANLRPRAPLGPGSSHIPSGLFNGMIAPLTPFSLRGVLWYQGETNASRAEAELYRTLFPALISGWRDRWGIGNLPFLFVQLANYEGVGTGANTEWPALRDAQFNTLNTVPATGMAVTIDAGSALDIHPKNKSVVGERLALAARAIAYGEHISYSGPLFRRLTTEGNSLRVWFTAAKGLQAKDGQPLKGFIIAGQNREFLSADARIKGDTIVVRNPSVSTPVAVRYAWADNPSVNLVNAEGLPASPFRSDRWQNAVVPKPTPTVITRPDFGKKGWETEINPLVTNVLILGDSISIGYTREVRHLLEGRANVVRPTVAGRDEPLNCRSTVQGLDELSNWLGKTKWTVIHFNWGLHDLCYRNPLSKDAGHRDKVNGKISVPAPQYEKNLEQLVGKLKETGACLVWANTTFVPDGEIGRFQGDERKYNEIAARVMTAHGIPINDLFTTTAGFPSSYFLGPGNVHFNAEANWKLGQQVAQSVRTALERCAPRGSSAR